MSFEMDGPFFTADINKTIDANVQDLMGQLAKVAEGEVRARVRANPEGNASRGYIRGRTVSIDPPGHQWRGYFVVSSTDKALDGPTQRRVNAQLSGRRTAVIERGFTARGMARVGTSIGTTRGGGGRQAFSSAASAVRRHILKANVIEGLD